MERGMDLLRRIAGATLNFSQLAWVASCPVAHHARGDLVLGTLDHGLGCPETCKLLVSSSPILAVISRKASMCAR